MTTTCVLFYLITPILMGLIGIIVIALLRFLIKERRVFIVAILCVLVAVIVISSHSIVLPEVINSCL